MPDDYPSGQPFLGGSAFNGFNNVGLANGFWNATGIGGNEATARRFFSVNTCQGCHGAETNTQEFQQVMNRKAGNPSSLSAFLLGCVPPVAAGSAPPQETQAAMAACREPLRNASWTHPVRNWFQTRRD